MVESALSLPLLVTSAFIINGTISFRATRGKRAVPKVYRIQYSVFSMNSILDTVYRILNTFSLSHRNYPVTLEIINERRQGNRILRIRRNFADENRALRGFLVPHNENIRNGERPCLRHLLADSFVHERLIDRDFRPAKNLQYRQCSAARLGPQMGEVNNRRRPRLALYPRTPAHFAAYGYHRRGGGGKAR